MRKRGGGEAARAREEGKRCDTCKYEKKRTSRVKGDEVEEGGRGFTERSRGECGRRKATKKTTTRTKEFARLQTQRKERNDNTHTHAFTEASAPSSRQSGGEG